MRPNAGTWDKLTGEAPLGVRVPEHAHIIDEEGLVFDRGLEPLEAVPGHVSERPPQSATATGSPAMSVRVDALDGDPRPLSDQDEVLRRSQ